MPRRWLQPTSDSLLGRLLARRVRHPEEFGSAVRVVEGEVPGEGARFRYRRSALDPLVVDGAREFTHGAVRMRLAADLAVGRTGVPGARPGHLVWRAHLADGSAVVEIAADVDVAARFGVT